ncbi:hypothetical protein LOTGIDRAFT_235835 [Lottia gigantea]|uniref:Uncharacterized protein n=1 Tax=Lottia gigantea TaxID=225164 RepID=V4B924_LOTGI|nr:hypothetical protein LOTGIDRAFT_235835 [Lottia gigantea]ESO85349.1 hypothetical protein LOTGIDRAFT_235835 [Lottia gigantea]
MFEILPTKWSPITASSSNIYIISTNWKDVHHAVFIPVMGINCGGAMTKAEAFPPLHAIHHNDSIQEQSTDHVSDVPKHIDLMKPKSRPSKNSGEETAELLLKKPTSRSSEDPFKELVIGYQRQGTRPIGQHRHDGARDVDIDQDFEYFLKEEHPSDSKGHRRYFDLHERGSILDKRSSKRLWTEEAIKEGKDLYHWQPADEQEIQDAVHRNFKGRYLVRKKDQAIKHLMEEKLLGASKKTYMHRKPKTRRRHRKSKQAETSDGVPAAQRQRRQWNIRSRHHFRSFDFRRLRRKPKVFDFIFEKMKPCFKDRRPRSDSVGYDHLETDEQDAEHEVFAQEDVLENSDGVLTNAMVTVEQDAVNVSVNQGMTELEVGAIETKIVSEASTVLPDGALIHSEEELISVRNMVVQKEDNSVDPSVDQRDQVKEYPTHSGDDLESSSIVARKSVSGIPANHNVPHTPKVLEKKQSKTGFNIYQDMKKVTHQIIGNQSRIPVSIAKNESSAGQHGILMDKQNVKLNLIKTIKSKMYSKIPVAVVPVPMRCAPQPKTRSSGTLTGRPGANQENMTSKPSSRSQEEPRAARKTKPRRTADQRKRGIPQRVFLQREN